MFKKYWKFFVIFWSVVLVGIIGVFVFFWLISAGKLGFMPTFEEAKVKLVFDKDSRKILGGQIISNIDLTQYMNTLSVVIQNEMTIEELAMTDFFFQPHFNKPWSLLNAVALKAL